MSVHWSVSYNSIEKQGWRGVPLSVHAFDFSVRLFHLLLLIDIYICFSIFWPSSDLGSVQGDVVESDEECGAGVRAGKLLLFM